MCETLNNFLKTSEKEEQPNYIGIEHLDIEEVIEAIKNQQSIKGNIFVGNTSGTILHISYHPKGNKKAKKHKMMQNQFVKTAFL